MPDRTAIYYRLIALWVLCEAMLGGIIHGFRIPVSGLFVGSCAVVCICLIGWYVPVKGAILKATVIVAIFKMMLSPQAPPPAYIAVFFQGLMGEILFWNRRFFKISCVLLGVIALLESGLQRIVVLTIVYGNDLWKAINEFLNGLTGQKQFSNYSLWLASGYVLLHVITGLLVGWWAALLPRKMLAWGQDSRYRIQDTRYKMQDTGDTIVSVRKKRRKRRIGLFVVWVLLLLLYAQSYFHIGTPLLPAHLSLRLFVRSVIIVLTWYFVAAPLLKQILNSWLLKKQMKTKEDVRQVLELLPSMQQLLIESWRMTKEKRGLKRIGMFSRIVLTSLPLSGRRGGRGARLLTGLIGSGKTTSLINWSANRNDVHGILTPVINGRRFFMDANTRKQWPMETDSFASPDDVLTVGRFVFSKHAFEKAIAVIHEAKNKDGWLVIDEIGPLELRGEGFAGVLKEMLQTFDHNIILVIREGLVEKVIEEFGIESFEVICDLQTIHIEPPFLRQGRLRH